MINKHTPQHIQKSLEDCFTERALAERYATVLQQALHQTEITDSDRANIEFELELNRLHIKRLTMQWIELAEYAYTNNVNLPIKDAAVEFAVSELYPHIKQYMSSPRTGVKNDRREEATR